MSLLDLTLEIRSNAVSIKYLILERLLFHASFSTIFFVIVINSDAAAFSLTNSPEYSMTSTIIPASVWI